MTRLAYLGVFLLALSTLMLEVLLTRITSVIAWYHLAFFVISLAMLGMTAGAVLVFSLPRLFPTDRVARRLAQATLAYAAAVPLCVGLAMTTPMANVTDLMTFLGLLGTGGVLALPFGIAGVALTLALTRAGLPPGLTYAVDLIGAAAGCALVILVLRILDAPSAALFAGALGALSAAAFAGAETRGAAAGGHTAQATAAPLPQRAPPGPRRAIGLAGTLSVLALLNAALPQHPFRPAWVKGVLEQPTWFADVTWNSYSRVTVDHEIEAPPPLWAKGRHTPSEVLAPVRQRAFRIDGAAATSMTALDDPRAYLAWDPTTFAHRLGRAGPAAVIGVGGGRDVLAALDAGHRPVVGIELNPQILDYHRGPYRRFSGLADAPGVTLVADEARSYLARTQRRFSVLTMSLIDTWASTGAGAYSLSENGLYTREAWNLFLERLSHTGIFTVSRWYVVSSPGETARMLALAIDTLLSRGVQHPRDHIIMVQAEQVATLLVARRPFSEGDVDIAQQEASHLGFNMLVTPRRLPVHPLLRSVAEVESRAELQALSSRSPLDLTPPTDRRPFFFSMLKPDAWLQDRSDLDKLDLPQLGNLQATHTLMYATLISLLLTLAALGVPFALRRAELRRHAPRTLLAACGYFALIGLGFMYVEIGMLSRLSVFLGHPTLALSVLLGGIILFTGIGSFASGRIDPLRGRIGRLYPALPAGLVVLVALTLGPTMDATQGLATPLRVVVSVLLLAPPALGMGLCFPLGLRLVEHLDSIGPRPDVPLGPWMWGINGAFGVCASGLSLGTSMVWGTHVTLLVGAACYALLLVTLGPLRHASC